MPKPKPLAQRVWEAVHDEDENDSTLWELAEELKAEILPLSILLNTLLNLARSMRRTGKDVRSQILKVEKLKDFMDSL